jgi:hypothetical protein
MKKETKQPKKLLALGHETIRKLDEEDLKHVAGASSCLPPPLPKS